MKIDFTNLELRATASGILFTFIVVAALILLPGCSSGIEQNNSSYETSFSGDKSFSFKDDGSDWQVDFEDDEISALYKNGTRIPDNEVEQHKEMIYENLNGLKSDFKDLGGNVHRFHIDMDSFGDEIKKFKRILTMISFCTSN